MNTFPHRLIREDRVRTLAGHPLRALCPIAPISLGMVLTACRRSLMSRTPLAFALVAGAIVLTAPALPAQGSFEGIVTISMIDDGEKDSVRMWIKGQQSRSEISTAEGMRLVRITLPGGRVITLKPDEKQYHVMQLPVDTDENDLGAFQATGRTETVAGQRCEFYVSTTRSCRRACRRCARASASSPSSGCPSIERSSPKPWRSRVATPPPRDARKTS
jgi:hypothetical protein